MTLQIKSTQVEEAANELINMLMIDEEEEENEEDEEQEKDVAEESKCWFYKPICYKPICFGILCNFVVTVN